MIRCPECKSQNSIFFEGVVSIPVASDTIYSEPPIATHYWDWDEAEVVDERGYFCHECDATALDPEDFVIQPN